MAQEQCKNYALSLQSCSNKGHFLNQKQTFGGKCIIADYLPPIFVIFIIQQMISKDDRSNMQVLHQTPAYCLNALMKGENQLLLLLCVYSPPKTFEQVITQEKMPETMKNTFGSLQKIHNLLKDPQAVEIIYEQAKIKIRVPMSKQKTKLPYKIVTLRLIQTSQDLYKMANAISSLKNKIQTFRKNPDGSLDGKIADQTKLTAHKPLKIQSDEKQIIDQKPWENMKLIEKMMDEKMMGLKKELAEAIRAETKRIEQEVKKEIKILVQRIYEENEREWERMVSFLINNLAAMTQNSLRNQFFSRQHSQKTFEEDSMQENSTHNQLQYYQQGKQRGNLQKSKFKKLTRSEQGEKKQAHLKSKKSKEMPRIPLKEKKSEIVGFMKRQKTDDIPLNFVDSSKDENQFSAQYSANYFYQSDAQADPSESLYNSTKQKKNPQAENFEEEKHKESSLNENDELEYEQEEFDESEGYSSEPPISDEEDIMESLKGKKFNIKGIGPKGLRNDRKQNQSSSREVGEHVMRNKDDSVRKSWKNSEKSLSKYPSNEES